MGFLSKLGLVVEKKDPQEADALSEEEMANILAEDGKGAPPKNTKIKPLTPTVGMPASPTTSSPPNPTTLNTMDFPQIYEAGKVQTPSHGFTILKVHGMLQGGRIGKMHPSVRGAVVLGVLEANSIPVEEIFEDAEARMACLEAYQQYLERKLVSGDDASEKEIARLGEELRVFTETVNQKIAVLNQEKFNRASAYRLWQERKIEEQNRIRSTVQALQESENVGKTFDGDPMFNSNPFQK